MTALIAADKLYLAGPASPAEGDRYAFDAALTSAIAGRNGNAAVLSLTLGKNGSFDFGINFERNDSNRAGRDYSTWDAGPSASLFWKF